MRKESGEMDEVEQEGTIFVSLHIAGQSQEIPIHSDRIQVVEHCLARSAEKCYKDLLMNF